MTKGKGFIYAAVFIAALAVGTLAWMYFKAPVYAEKEISVRNGNAALEMKIDEIEALGGSTLALDKGISDAKDRIRERYAVRTYTPKTACERAEEACALAGVKDARATAGNVMQISPAGTLSPALCTAEVTIVFEGKEERGAAVIRGLESCWNADFEVVSFTYSNAASSEEEGGKSVPVYAQVGDWTIVALIYYYE